MTASGNGVSTMFLGIVSVFALSLVVRVLSDQSGTNVGP